MKVLVTGGAGYVGCVLVPLLLDRGYQVRVFDNLTFGGRGLLPYLPHPHFEFVKGDICHEATLARALKDADAVIHLAAIVGYPACNKQPSVAHQVNVEGTRNLARLCSRGQPIIFASTGSNYGALAGELCTEETLLNPQSVYGRTKTEAEQVLLEAGNAVCYRFATAFGVSPRMRLDLLINDFVYRAFKERSLILYERSFKRTFIHVRDMGRSFLFALDNFPKMRNQAYNVGSESLNFTKEEIALEIKERIDYYLHFAEIGQDEDKRNYEVSYRKIRALGYETTISLEQGIEELVKAAPALEVVSDLYNA